MRAARKFQRKRGVLRRMYQVVPMFEGKPMVGTAAATPREAAEEYARERGLPFGTMLEVYDHVRGNWVAYQVVDDGVRWCGLSRAPTEDQDDE